VTVLGWKKDALCRTDPGGHWDGDMLPSMYEMCMACPVRDDCLMEALGHEERCDVGVWGGTGPEERRRIRKGKDPYVVWREVAEMMETA
jgi:WhiB family transcriptional regulator, redox-sensing transcriptional regulator